EDAGLARGHRIDEAGLSPDDVARGGAFAPHLRALGRMLGIGPAYLVPPAIEAHSSHPRRYTSGAVRGRRRPGSGAPGAGGRPRLPETSRCSSSAVFDTR